MAMKSKAVRIVATVVALILIGGLGYWGYRLNGEKKSLAAELEQVESRNRLLDQKYKEEKALVGRLQREKLTLSGEVRQAKMDLEGFEAKSAGLREENARMKKELKVCGDEKTRLSARIDKLDGSLEQLNTKLNDTASRLKAAEDEKASLKGKVQELNANLREAQSKNKRYLSQNRKLAKIAKALVARVEKGELGSSVLVKEPLIQFKRVELEKLLQDYLDGIDAAKVVE
jgi:chromosome segregation ATPase